MSDEMERVKYLFILYRHSWFVINVFQLQEETFLFQIKESFSPFISRDFFQYSYDMSCLIERLRLAFTANEKQQK